MPDEPIDPSAQPPIVARPLMLQPINGQQSGLNRQRNRKKRFIVRICAIVVAVIVGIGFAAWLWYSVQLLPLTSDKQKLVAVTIESGSTPSQIGQLLQDKSIIRSSLAFDINTRLSGTRGTLKYGTYRLSSAQSIPQIVEHLVNGKVDQFSITFYPGVTLVDTTTKPENRRDVTTTLALAGYSLQEINSALKKSYNSPLFEGKPTGTDFEGYVYGDTYNFNAGASVEDILQRTFDEFAKVVKDNNLVAAFKGQGLTLYQGITLASIIQREARTPTNSFEPSSDQKQIAQVFYTRLHANMPLGSDVTFIYAANKLGVTPISTLDSPYNTRIVTGLPPGPVASPGITALKATAAPATGDYVYFVAGDDGKVYFGRTLEEHQANVAKYCSVECNKP